MDLTFRGAAGQSFGAFLVQGQNVRLEGEANDYVGKCMNSGRITLVPADGCATPGDQVILGNTCLYGATGGELFAHGRAGERFGVRNSGARTVVEGAGDHCCEYMTGGVVVVLGSTGRNVGAGMTGGVAFLLDEGDRVIPRVNPEIVEVCSITTAEQESTLKELADSQRPDGGWSTAQLLSDWKDFKRKDKQQPDLVNSDAYATGLALIVLRGSGYQGDDPRINSALTWIETHQDEDGKWFTASPSKDSKQYFTNIGTAFAVLGLDAYGRIEPGTKTK